MARTVALWIGESPITFEEAEKFLQDESLQELESNKPPNPILLHLVSELLQEFPEPDLDDEDFDDDSWVWTSSPMENDIEGDRLVLGIKWGTTYESVARFVLEKARAHNVNFLDWDNSEYFRAVRV